MTISRVVRKFTDTANVRAANAHVSLMELLWTPHLIWILQQAMCSGRTKKKAVGGTTPRQQKRWDFNAVYYTGVHNRSAGESPSSPNNSSTGNVRIMLSFVLPICISTLDTMISLTSLFTEEYAAELQQCSQMKMKWRPSMDSCASFRL